MRCWGAALLGALLVAGPAGRARAIGGAAKGDLSIQATGSVRLLAGYLHFPDEPVVFAAGDDGLAAAVGRVILDGGLARDVSYEVHGYTDLSRLPALGLGGASLSGGGAFATVSSFDTPYRTPYLAWGYWRSGSVTGQLGVDRLNVKVRRGRLSLSAGRFPINHSVTQLFTPNDFFAPFSATTINRIYKPGVDALRLGVSLGELATLEVAGVLGNDPGGAPCWGRSALLARASFVRWRFEWAALGGRLAERWVVGGSLQGNIGPIGLRAEGHAGFPDRDGDGRLDGDRPVHGRVAGGLGKEFALHNIAIGAEYLYQSDGAGGAAAYLTQLGRRYPDDQPYLGQHYVGARVGGEIIPVLKANVVALVNAADGSGLALASLAYDISDEATFIAGLIAPWGARPVISAGALSALGSEYGLTPLSAFVEMRFYF